MKNIFIQLKAKNILKKEPLLKLLDIDPEEENLPDHIESYFDQEEHSTSDNISFIFTLIEKHTENAIKEKLYAMLVFWASKAQAESTRKIVDRVEQSKESISTKVRFFSLLYKSSEDNELKKKLLLSSINLIEQENKISIFSNFVQNFDNLISSLTFNHNEYANIYLKLINYLEKHIVYKNVWKHYIVRCLATVKRENGQAQEVDLLILKLLKSSEVTEETVKLLNQEGISKNKYYPYLETLLLGDFDKFAKLDKQLLESSGIKSSELERRVKIEAIPRALSSQSTNVQIVSYQQVSEILHIEKDDVEPFIIEAIQEGILRAKIDEASETIIVNSVKFRTLRGEERASLQKNLTQLATRLQQIAQ